MSNILATPGLADLVEGAWYLESNEDLKRAGIEPLLHFLEIGWAEGRNPNPLFDTEWYFSKYPDVEISGANPLLHFHQTGWKELRQPHPLFDVSFYLKRNADVAAANINPLLHYLHYGWREGRQPHPLFDTQWYVSQCTDTLKRDPLSHYIQSGAKALLNPNRLFDARWYVERYPDSAANPLAHFADLGLQNRLSPHPLFDVEYYLSTYPDVLDAGVNPLVHFVLQGYMERRRPNSNFNSDRYAAIHGQSTDPFSIFEMGFPGSADESVTAPDGLQQVLHTGDASTSEWQTRANRDEHILPHAEQRQKSHEGQNDLFNQMFEITTGARSPMYAPLTRRTAYVRPTDPKTIAFYLPQFHAFEENDRWWGKGFTEWTNVSKAVPQFSGHYQPRLPGELGHYDLRLPEVMERQIELARQFGIHGFCFHYYWFSGKRLLEKPLDMFLSRTDAAFDFPFCLCWANENWTRRWDGAEDDVLMQQSHDEADHAAVFNDLLRYMKDPRYIKINNRPVVVIYRPVIIDDLSKMVEIWRIRAREEGFDDIFLIATNSFGFDDHTTIDFDGLCEFPPHNIVAAEQSGSIEMFNKSHEGKIYQYTDARDFCLNRLERIRGQSGHESHFPTVMLGWDNEARKPGRGNVFVGANPREFFDWLIGAFQHSLKVHQPDARLVFANAWNEWGEGTYLEPDRWFGYGYLNAVAAAYETLNASTTHALRPSLNSQTARKKSGAVLLHAFYHDLLPELADRLTRPWVRDRFDIIVTVPSHWTHRQMHDAFDILGATNVLVTPNVGRDMFPFLQALESIELIDYDVALKLHTKKSPHLQQGARWGQAILDSLTGEREVDAVCAEFARNAQLGLMAPQSLSMPFHDPSSLRDNRQNIDYLVARYNLQLERDARFIAGSMFWFRPTAFEKLRANPLGLSDFGPELGGVDGTMAHAMERLLLQFVHQAGFTAQTYMSESDFNPYL